MQNSFNKRRNFTKQPCSDNKPSSARFSPPSSTIIASLQPTVLKEKPFRQIEQHDTSENIRKKSQGQGLKFAHYSMIQSKYGGLSKKIKNLLEADYEKENSGKEREGANLRENFTLSNSNISALSASNSIKNSSGKLSMKESPKHGFLRRSELPQKDRFQ